MSDRSQRFLPVILVLIWLPVVLYFWYRSAGKSAAVSTLREVLPTQAKERYPNRSFARFLPKSTQARCLDGSQPAYYIRHGSGSGMNKWIVMFEGGGWCYDLEQCYLRSKTILGSSKTYPQQFPEEMMNFYISANDAINPHMHNWNTVLVRYCDGSSFAGNSEVKYKGTTLHFKGAINRDATIRSLFTLQSSGHFKTTLRGVSMDVNVHTANMSTADEVVIAGCSAGALGVLLGLDQMADIVRSTAAMYGNHHVTVRGLVDSGYFMEYSSSFKGQETHNYYGKDDAVTATTKRIGGNDFINYPVAMRDVFTYMNISAGAHPACLASERAASRSAELLGNGSFSVGSGCVFAANLVPHIKTPMFLLQPQYDQWQILHIYSQAYTPDGVNAYGAALVSSLKSTLFHAKHPGHGAFIDSCSHHCTSCSDLSENTWSGPRVKASLNVSDTASGTVQLQQWNEAEAFHVWYQASLAGAKGLAGTPPQPGLSWFIQDHPYPCVDCCKCSVDMIAVLQASHQLK